MKLTEKQHKDYAMNWFWTGIIFLILYAFSYGGELPLLIIILFCLFEAQAWGRAWYNKYVKGVKVK